MNPSREDAARNDAAAAILEPLNERQRLAVSAPLKPVLVIAGAGSGKTRVLTHRVAWLVATEDVAPQSILAVTFTNKAAGEMRGRIEDLLRLPGNALWVGTFHGIAHRLLRMHWREAGLPQSFQILDSEDQFRFLRRVLKSMDLDESTWDPKEVRSFINIQKNEALRPEDLRDERDPARAQLARIYATYQEQCDRAGLVDFAELLLRAFELWTKGPELLAHYRQRFRHLLVDEFQDTNVIQYRWLKLLAGKTGLPFVVGDDDQSIYRWRGARIEHIHRFQRDFSAAELVKLEQNYRSTGTILTAANALIANNSSRLGKELWTAGAQGEHIQVYAAYNERDEAEFVANRVKSWVADGGLRREIAVLYRSNAQSRVFEESFINEAIPYRVYGGLRFFEREEIKDALAYLRLTENRNDDAAFERVVNKPARGIGTRTVELLRDYARANTTSMWSSAGALVTAGLAKRAANAVHEFLRLIEALAGAIGSLPLHEQVDHVISQSGLLAHYRKDLSERGQGKVENLEELVSAARGFNPADDSELPPLVEFLAHAALEAGEGQGDAWEDCVQMMTLHSAKGLEFPVVFMCGMENGLFPHRRSMQDLASLEEERRLCYVGATRAMQRLYLTHAEQRRLYGQDNYTQASRFLGEFPPELLEEIRPQIKIAQPVYKPRPRPSSEGPGGIRLGQRVRHRKFGEGVVLNFDGQGAHARIQVNFETAGTKELVLAYAKLELL